MTSSIDESTSSLDRPDEAGPEKTDRSARLWGSKSDMGLFSDDLGDGQTERPTVTRRYPLTLYAEFGSRSEGRPGSAAGQPRPEGAPRQPRQLRLGQLRLPPLRVPKVLLTPIGKRDRD